MNTVRIRTLVVLIVISITAWLLIVGCGSNADTDELASPEVTATTRDVQTVTMIVPTDASAVFKMIASIAVRSGQPFDVNVLYGDSVEAGVRAVMNGRIDLMLVMLEPLHDEPVSFLEIFHTPVVIFVNSGLGIHNLTREQAAALFSGEVTNWSQIGGPDVPVLVFVQDEADTATIALQNHLLGDRPITDSAQVLFGDRKIIMAVNGLPGAVGYSSLSIKRLIEDSVADDLAEIVSLDGLFPSDPDYPIIASVGFIYLPEKQAELQLLLDWAISFRDSDMGKVLLDQYGGSLVTSPDAE